MLPRRNSSSSTFQDCFVCSKKASEKCVECGEKVCRVCAKKSGCVFSSSAVGRPKTGRSSLPTVARPSLPMVERCLGRFCIEAPPFAYSLSTSRLSEIIEIFGLESNPELIEKARKKTLATWGQKISGDLILELMPKHWPLGEKAQVFTSLSKLENHQSEQTKKGMHIKTKIEIVTKNPFSSLSVSALFCDPQTKVYFFVPLVIDKSTIGLAGMGVYTEAEIPKGSRGFYRGTVKSEKAQNPHYSWTINSWSDSGKQQTDIEYFKDATSLNHSNWARFVNCPNHGVKCNMKMKQRFHNIFYEATEDIPPGSELFVDYGDGYREDNLGIKVKNYAAKARCLGPGGPRGLGHLLTRRLSSLSHLPMNCVFECSKKGCEFYETEFFWCDGCEKAVIQEKFAEECRECCQLSCKVCLRVWKHTH